MNCPAPFARFLSVFAFASLVFSSIPLIASAEEIDYANLSEEEIAEALKPIPPRTPSDALRTLERIGGIRTELAAYEPFVLDPVAGCIDENGIFYVCELADYPYRPEEGEPPLGKVRVLLDQDGDGFYETSTLFADDLLWPAGIAPWKGGVYVTSPPNIWYLKDTNGDGVADIREKVYTGFGDSGAQYIMNNLKWGMDHNIYLSVAGNGGEVVPAKDANGEPLSVRRRDFRFSPSTGDYDAISGGEQFANTFDDWGNRFLCSQDTFLYQVVYPIRYLERNPLLSVPDTQVKLVPGGSPIFRVSPVEVWRAIRSSRRILSGKGHEGNSGVSHNVSDGVAGTTVYRGDALPASFYGNTFSGDAQNNLVHRRTLERDGVTFVSERADEGTEFLRSDDNWFRPVNFLTAPDGSLYVFDLCREILEAVHIPMDVVKHLDLTKGRDYGRIYRVVGEDWKRPEPPQLGEASTKELVGYLEHPNGWWRDTAHRLIYERQDASAEEDLRELMHQSKVPQARLLALYSLQGLKKLTAGDVQTALNDAHPGVREQAVFLSESFLPLDDGLKEALLQRVEDPDTRVRYQLAYTLGEWPDSEEKTQALGQIAIRGLGDPYVRTAVLSSTYPCASDLLGHLLSKKEEAEGLDSVLHELAGMAAYQMSSQEAATWLNAHLNEEAPDALLLGLNQGLQDSGKSFREVSKDLSIDAQEILAEKKSEAFAVLKEDGAEVSEWESALRFLSLFPLQDISGALTEFLNGVHPDPIRAVAIETLAATGDPSVPERLLDQWKVSGPQARRAILAAVLKNEASIDLLLGRLEEGNLLPSELDASTKSRLLNHPNAEIQSRAKGALQGGESPSIEEAFETFQPSLELEGDFDEGKEIFELLCSGCHLINGLGRELGPNLALTASRSRQELLVNILDPNREVDPKYLQFHVTTRDEEIHSGMLAAETSQSVTLKNQDEDITIPREEIVSIVGSGLSVMPDGLTEGLDEEMMASLLRYLSESQYDLGTSGESFPTDMPEKP
ncbi:MAG: hypothetical protein KC931_04485 [Candidatus Omnitrophica bacterium]|nr:hypothetical protein [Candidatus Omnitrophota bacterium]